jgi:molybdopterin/thiamine biosynthesis adenylyltransferase
MIGKLDSGVSSHRSGMKFHVQGLLTKGSRIQKSDVAIINLRGVGSEIVKNLVLAGIHCLTVVDSQKVANADQDGHMFYSKTDCIGQYVSLKSEDVVGFDIGSAVRLQKRPYKN